MQAFFWSVLATLTLVWGYFRMFETKGRTFGELDYMVRVLKSAMAATRLTLVHSSRRAFQLASLPKGRSTRVSYSLWIPHR